MAHETEGLRLSGSVHLFPITVDGEQPALGPLAASVLSMAPQVEKFDIADKRRARRGQTLYSVSDPQSTTGSLTLLSVSQRTIALNLMGSVSEVSTSGGSVSGEKIYLEPDLSDQLAQKNVSSVTLDSGVQASVETGIEGSDNAITWTASSSYPGTEGNAITVALVDPSANNAALSVSVTGTAITVSLATGVAGAIESTAAEVMAAIEGNAAASALVTVADTGTSAGTGVVAAVAASNLTGGAISGGTSYTLDTDFSVNTRLGIIRALETGGITAGHYYASYSYAATSATRLTPSTTSTVRCRLLMDATNDGTGQEAEYEAYSMVLTPSGELDILNDEPVNLEFAVTYETPSGKDAPFRYDVITRT